MPRLHWLSERLRSVVTVHASTLGRTGTGFVVSVDGHLLTAAHCVVDDSAVPAGGEHETEEDITVAFHDGGTYSVQLVGFDMHADVAVLRLPPDVRLLSPIPVRRHTYPQPGDTCVVVGNIFGQDPRSVAVGAVRNGRWQDPHGLSLLSTVLTDIATGAGTSGGPILDAAGYVVAIHTAAYGAPPSVCSLCGEAFRNTGDLGCHTAKSHGVDEVTGHTELHTGTTMLGGGVTSPVLWRLYRAILARCTPGTAIPRSTLPCDTIPCVPGNVWRIRAAIGDNDWTLPAVTGCCVVRPDPASGLRPGDVVVADAHELVWLLTPGRACAVHVVRGTRTIVLTVQTRMLPSTRDVAQGSTQVVVTVAIFVLGSVAAGALVFGGLIWGMVDANQ